MQLQLKDNILKYKLINVYKVYNLFFNNYNNIVNRDNFNAIQKMLEIQKKNVIISNFNLYYSLQRKSLYFRQYRLFDNLLNIIPIIDTIFALLQDIITRNY